jgi:hypothetical protein
VCRFHNILFEMKLENNFRGGSALVFNFKLGRFTA